MRSFIKNMALVADIFSPPVFIAVILTLYMVAPACERKDKQAMKEQRTETAQLSQKDSDPDLPNFVNFFL